METQTKDTVEHVKKEMMNVLLELLISRPEEERTLLSMIVNKFGETDRKIAKFTSTLLKRLLRAHPNMTCIVLQQIGQFVSRAGIPSSSITLMIKFVNKLQSIPATIVKNALMTPIIAARRTG